MARLIAAFVVLVAACGAGRDRGPAWPARTEPETDGGESLAPRSARVVAAEAKVTKTEDKAEAKAETKPDDAKADDKPPGTTEPVKATTTTTPTEDIIIIDDIVIEIED
jgi:hypothetical protein